MYRCQKPLLARRARLLSRGLPSRRICHAVRLDERHNIQCPCCRHRVRRPHTPHLLLGCLLCRVSPQRRGLRHRAHNCRFLLHERLLFRLLLLFSGLPRLWWWQRLQSTRDSPRYNSSTSSTTYPSSPPRLSEENQLRLKRIPGTLQVRNKMSLTYMFL